MDQAGEVLFNLFAPPLVAACIGIIALGLGSWLTRPFTGTKRPPLVESFAIGTLVISLLTFFWGFLGWMGTYAKWSLGLVLVLVGITGLIQNSPKWSITTASFKNRTIIALSLLLAAGVIMRIILNPLFPPLANDECSLYIPSALQILESGRMEFNAETCHIGTPQNAVMLYLWSITAAPVTTSHYINFIAFIFLLLGIVRLGRVVYSQKIGWLAALITASLLELQLLAGQASPDIWLLFYIVTALLCLAEGAKDNNPGRMLLAGILIGGAAGNGYTAILAVVTLALSFLSIGKKDNISFKIPSWAIYTSITLFILIAAPGFVRNIIWYGNPVFPYYSWFFFPEAGVYSQYAMESAVKTSLLFQDKTAFHYFEQADLWWQILKLWPTWIAIPAGMWFWKSSVFARLSITWTVLVWGFWLIIGKGIMHFPFLIFLVPVNILMLAHLIGKVYSLPPGTERGRFFRIIFWILLIGWIGIAGAGTARLNPPLTRDMEVQTLRRFHGSYDLISAANNTISENLNAIGILCEDGRLYAEFTLIGGGKVGWGNHRVLVENVTSAEELADKMMERYNANYLIVDWTRLNQQQGEEFQRIKYILQDRDFPEYFKEVVRVGQGVVYVVR